MIQKVKTKKEDFADSPLIDFIESHVGEHISPYGPWLAGGALRRQLSPFEGWNGTDYDLYFRNREQFNDIVADLSEQEHYDELYRDENKVVSFWDTENELKVQLISHQFGDSIQDILNGFDLTVCMVGWDGWNLHYGDKLFEHLESGELHFNEDSHNFPESILGAFYRSQKYLQKGYFFPLDSIKKYNEMVVQVNREQIINGTTDEQKASFDTYFVHNEVIDIMNVKDTVKSSMEKDLASLGKRVDNGIEVDLEKAKNILDNAQHRIKALQKNGYDTTDYEETLKNIQEQAKQYSYEQENLIISTKSTMFENSFSEIMRDIEMSSDEYVDVTDKMRKQMKEKYIRDSNGDPYVTGVDIEFENNTFNDLTEMIIRIRSSDGRLEYQKINTLIIKASDPVDKIESLIQNKRLTLSEFQREVKAVLLGEE